MLCQKCNMKNATSHIHYVLNGVVRDIYLCTDCAKEYQKSQSFDGDVFKMLSSLLNENMGNVKTAVKCECCGTDFNEIRRTGKVGCANCYKTFEAQLAPTVARIHGKTVHVGKKPQTAEPTIQPPKKEPYIDPKEQRIKALKEQMALAIKNEEFEKAAELRDLIKAEEA